MKTNIPEILAGLGESEYDVLASTYCKLQELRGQIGSMHDDFVTRGTPPTFDRVAAAHLLIDDLFGEVEEYVLALAKPGEEVCDLYRKVA